MLPSTSFFKSVSLVKKKTGANKVVINVGMDSFHALAFAVIDNQKNDVILPKLALEEVLSKLFKHYESYKIIQSYLTPLERLRIILNSPKKSELVTCFAFALKQIAVDEILKNPVVYKDSFSGFTSDTLEAHLRNENTVLPSSALNALATALNIKIVLSFRDDEKKLREREIYPKASTSNFELELDVKEGEFAPAVKNKNDMMMYVGKSPLPVPKPKIFVGNQTLAPQFALIDQDNQIIWKDYKHNISIINGLIVDKKLTTAQLIDLYTKFLPSSTELVLFNRLEKEFKEKEATNEPDYSGNMMMLVKGLARGLSANHINSDKFFEPFEDHDQHHTSAPAA